MEDLQELITRFVRHALAEGASPSDIRAGVEQVLADYEQYPDPALIARSDLASGL